MEILQGDNHKGEFRQKTYGFLGASGDFIAKIDMEFINLIATSPIPYSEFWSLINLAKDFKTDMEEHLRRENKRLKKHKNG